MVAMLRGDSYLWGRVGEKSHGISVPIEGDYQPGDVVVQLDDVITDSKSKTESAVSLTTNGPLETAGFVIMFDREEGGVQSLNAAGHELVAVTGLAESMAILRENGRIGQQEFDWVAQYHQNLRDDGVL